MITTLINELIHLADTDFLHFTLHKKFPISFCTDFHGVYIFHGKWQNLHLKARHKQSTTTQKCHKKNSTKTHFVWLNFSFWLCKCIRDYSWSTTRNDSLKWFLFVNEFHPNKNVFTVRYVELFLFSKKSLLLIRLIKRIKLASIVWFHYGINRCKICGHELGLFQCQHFDWFRQRYSQFERLHLVNRCARDC